MKNDNVIYRMPKETAGELFHADLALLVKYAFENGSRIATAPDAYLKFIIATTMILAALAKLDTNTNAISLLDIFQKNKGLYGIIYGGAALIGVLKLLDVVRMRYHYVKVVRYVNQLRSQYLSSLDLDALGNVIWTHTDIKMWPIDSVSTFAAIGLAMATGCSALICSLVFTNSLPWALCLALLVIIPPAYFSKKVNAKLST